LIPMPVHRRGCIKAVEGPRWQSRPNW
jgi:hypothetical protein